MNFTDIWSWFVTNILPLLIGSFLGYKFSPAIGQVTARLRLAGRKILGYKK